MISKKLIKDCGLRDLNGYFENTVNNFINGNKSEVVMMINQMSKPQAVDFLEWLKGEITSGQNTAIHNELNSLTLKSLKR